VAYRQNKLVEKTKDDEQNAINIAVGVGILGFVGLGLAMLLKKK
jgi:hypothetical protein